jgi:hypothetical protein
MSLTGRGLPRRVASADRRPHGGACFVAGQDGDAGVSRQSGLDRESEGPAEAARKPRDIKPFGTLTMRLWLCRAGPGACIKRRTWNRRGHRSLRSGEHLLMSGGESLLPRGGEHLLLRI